MEKKKEKKRKIFTVDQGLSRREWLSYPVKLKSGKSSLRRLRPCESWWGERIKIMFPMLPQKYILMYMWKEKSKQGWFFRIKLLFLINSKNATLHNESSLMYSGIVCIQIKNIHEVRCFFSKLLFYISVKATSNFLLFHFQRHFLLSRQM